MRPAPPAPRRARLRAALATPVPLALALALALAACDGDGDGDGDGDEPAAALPSGAWTEADSGALVLPLWIPGEAELVVAAESPAPPEPAIEPTIERDGAPPRALGTVPADGRPVALPLPPGPAAALVRLPLEGAVPRRIDLVDREAPPPARASAAGRSVVLVVLDSLAATHLSCYGAPRDTSPFLDRLAARGVRFASAYSQTAWTLPSVASLFTSEEQERHGVLANGLALDEAPSTLAELARAAGYRTVGLIQNGTVGAQSGLDRGFDAYDGFRWGAAETADLLRRVLRELQEADGPVLVYAHLIAPHMPYVPSDAARARYAAGYDGPVDGSLESCRFVAEEAAGPDDPHARQLAALYDAYVRTIDARIGELVAAVEAAGLGDEVLWLVTSDHGEAFLEHGRQGHGPLVHEEMVRVPLVLAAPGAPWSDGRVVDAPVSLLDVLPTLVDLLGLPAPRQTPRGRSLAPWLATGEPPPRPLLLSSRYVRGEAPEQLGLRAGRWKWIRDAATGAGRLYDLARDPGESRDVAADHPVTARVLDALLDALHAEASAARRPAGERRALDPALARDLEALGYAGDE